MRTIKSASAHLINRQLKRNGGVWQEESFDHVLRSSEGLDAKVNYVLQNPVRKGLAKDWREYKWAWQRQDQAPAENAHGKGKNRVARTPRPGWRAARHGVKRSFTRGADEASAPTRASSRTAALPPPFPNPLGGRRACCLPGRPR
jgi:hypothetical protein